MSLTDNSENVKTNISLLLLMFFQLHYEFKKRSKAIYLCMKTAWDVRLSNY